jgi:hypothetical protein
MNTSRARMLVLATAAIVSCGKGAGGGTSSGDAGVHGPTDLVVTWTLAGKPASSADCTANGATQTFVNLSGTIDPSLHQTQTVDCATGTVTFSQLLVEKLGMPDLEGTLLDSMGKTVQTTHLDVMPVLGTTNVTLAFFAPSNTGGGGGMPTTTASHAASTSGAGGAGGGGGATGTGGKSTTASTSGGTGGAPTTTAASSSSGSIQDAGGGG